MTDEALTAERREELLALLENEQRLQSEYPKLAEYLASAPRLAGTGNDQADAAFDLRLIKYMTGSRSESTNPYWDTIAPAVSYRGGRRVVDGGSPQGSSRLAFAQMVLHDVYAYAVPSPETIDWIAEICSGLTVLELGAGRGYWAAQLVNAGLQVAAYDVTPQDIWHQVIHIDQLSQTSPLEQCVLMLCWPPGWGDAMAANALRTFKAAGGRRLIYIGEPQGGKTANDEFFDALAAQWSLQSSDPHFVTWWNLKDSAQVWSCLPTSAC